MNLTLVFSCLLAILATISGYAQTTGDAPTDITGKAFSQMNAKYSGLADRLQQNTQKVLEKMQRKEAAMFRRLHQKDSTQAAQLDSSSKKGYDRLFNRLNAPSGVSSPTQYYSALDSVHTGMEYIQTTAPAAGFSAQTRQRAGQLAANSARLQQQLEISGEVETFLHQREQQWKTQLGQYADASQLLGVNKQVFYYQQQVAQYKEMLNDKDRLEEKALSTIQQAPGFQQFWEKNSVVARLFPQPQLNGVVLPQTGLQSSTEVQKLIASQLMPGQEPGAIPSTSLLQDKVGQAQDQLSGLKDRISGLANSLGGSAGGSTSMTMPDFKPNSQHNKTFFQRIETGFSVQSGPSTNLLPVTLTPAVYAGYRFSDNVTAGIGGAYIVGLGQSFRQFKMSSQGVSLRSYLDVKLKGSFWLTGGFEYNYLQEFAGLQAIRNLDAWRKSALVGLTKKYTVGKKEGKLQLLFDALYAHEIPKGQPIVYRVAYSF